jgi:hypothetical protein
MTRDDVIQILKRERARLSSQYGVETLLLFGSVARDEANVASDIDLLVAFNRPAGYFGLFSLQDELERLLGCSVDLGTVDSIKPRIRERVMAESIRVA